MNNNNNNDNLFGSATASEQLNAADPMSQPAAEPIDGIVSVNKKGVGVDNKLAKAIFFLFIGALLVGLLTWFGQSWLDRKKADMRASSAPKAGEPAPNLFNPEKSDGKLARPMLGSELGGRPGPAEPVVAGQKDCLRPLRGKDGKVITNAQGNVLAADCDGNIIEVPAIGSIVEDKKALPIADGQGSGQPQPKPPSRYGGSLFVGNPPKPDEAAAGALPAGAPNPMAAYTQLLKGLGGGMPGALPPTPAPTATPFFGQPAGSVYDPNENAKPREGTVASALLPSATPVALAKRFPNQNLMLPKGRQADCILTGRIVDEVAGFTSCVLAANLYSDNGRVLLLERGSELTGEYSVTNQLGSERLFVTWQRIKTPQGIEVDLASPGSDRLGTSGLPGQLDNRWGARIAAALLISIVKDISVAVINNQSKTEGGGTNVNVGSAGQNTATTSGQLAEEVIKQTLKVRPRLTINEGTRIAIYVARDLDFSSVYALREAGSVGTTRLLTQ